MESKIREALIEREIMGENWKMKIANKEIIGRSDWAKIIVEITAPKKRKPCIAWELAINIVRGQINWEESTHYNY